MFSDSDNESINAEADNVQLTVNEHYAKAFNYRKEREELEKLKEKYGSDYEEGEDEEDEDESTDSESAESEDEDGEELTPVVDAAILRTLARIRKKDPAIYDSSKSIFGEEEKVVQSQNVNGTLGKKEKKEKGKPVTLRQANLDAVLRGSRSPSPSLSEAHQQPTHVEEQRALRQETIAAFHDAVSDEDDLLIPREKTKDEIEAEEEEYRAYLERQVGEDLGGLITVKDAVEDEEVEQDEKKKKKKKKKEKDVKSKADKDQEFLLDYILNRGWIDQSSKRVPTYNEITSTKISKKGKSKAASPSSSENEDANEDPALLSDTSFTSLADIFETSYNHRFEEPNASTIPSFPRQIESTVRREESKRKEARERRKARKEEEMRVRKEEVRRMKALKMKEVKRKLERIARESGMLKNKNKKKGGGEEAYEGDAEEEGLDVEAALQELDLEGEWDPEKHDRQMEGLFANEEEVEEGEEVQYDEDGKPVWNDDVDIGDIHMSEDDAVPVASSSKKDKKKKKKKKSGEEEAEGVDVDMMDADRVGELDDDEEEWDGTEEMRKRKWNEYMAQLDEMDFNDLVGGQPTRFKYVPIPTQTYSLDPVEILLADDKDLNEYMSIKKYAPYRKDKGDRARWDPKQKEKLQEFKKKVKEREVRFFGSTVSGDGRGGDEVNGREGGEKTKKKRKGKKERMKMKEAGGDEAPVEESVKAEEKQVKIEQPEESNTSKQKKRKREEKEEKVVEEEVSSKKKRRRRHGKKTATDEGVA